MANGILKKAEIISYTITFGVKTVAAAHSVPKFWVSMETPSHGVQHGTGLVVNTVSNRMQMLPTTLTPKLLEAFPASHSPGNGLTLVTGNYHQSLVINAFTNVNLNSMVANVAFDLWTSAGSSGDYEYEIMIWLAAIGGAGPLGSQVGSFSYEGTDWSLYEGTNGVQKVYSFVAGKQIESITSDALPFLTHLVDSGYFASSQYLRAIQAGTEPFLGNNAELTTSAYSVEVK